MYLRDRNILRGRRGQTNVRGGGKVRYSEQGEYLFHCFYIQYASKMNSYNKKTAFKKSNKTLRTLGECLSSLTIYVNIYIHTPFSCPHIFPTVPKLCVEQ